MVAKAQNLFNTLLLLTSSVNAARSFNFEESSVALNGSLYQSTYNNGTLYLTSSVGRPPVNESYLFKVDAESLKVLQTANPGYDNRTHQLWATYGIASDPAHNSIWVTNTRQQTISIYGDSDLKVIRHLPNVTSGQTRDVAIAQKLNKAYVSTSTSSNILVYDSNSFEHLGNIDLARPNQNFTGVMALHIDEPSSELFTVSLSSNVAARVDLGNNNAISYYQLGNDSQRASAVAYDPKRKHLFVVSQGSPDILVVDTSKGESAGQSKLVTVPSHLVSRAVEGDVQTDIKVEAGGLAAAYDPTNDLVYAANRQTADIYVIDADSLEVIDTLKTGKFPNHITLDNQGNVYVVDKGTPSKLHRYAVTNNGTSGTGATGGNSTGSGNSTSGHGGAGAGGAVSSGSGSGNKTGGAAGSASGSRAPQAGNGAMRAVFSAGVLIAPVAALLI